jgi:hypothetical protein
VIAPRNISYDFKTGRGVVVVEEGQRCDASEVAEFFGRIPQVRFVRVTAGRRPCARFEKLERHWVAYR